MYIDADGTTYATHDEIRKAFKEVSFPRSITDETLAEFGIKPLVIQPDPVTAPTEVVDEKLELVDGVWVKVKEKRPATPEELDSKTQAEEARVRKRIADELTATNWTQLLDTDSKTQKDNAAYRALLRAIPAQQGFPFTVTWPVKP